MSTPSPSNEVGLRDVVDEIYIMPTQEAAAAFINIKVESQTADDVVFRIKRGVQLRRLMDMYCGKLSLDPMSVRFLGPERRRIRPSQTPDEVGLRDGDAIDVMLVQEGSSAFIDIKVQSQAADDVVFCIKRDAKLRRLMDMYCAKKSLHPMAVRLLDPGRRPIRPDQTPDEVGLRDGDAIGIMLTQEEGAAFIKIKIKVRSQTADDVWFRIKRDVMLWRLMDMYCGKQSMDPMDVSFICPEGRRIRRDQTPDEVDLEDGDEIYAMPG